MELFLFWVWILSRSFGFPPEKKHGNPPYNSPLIVPLIRPWFLGEVWHWRATLRFPIYISKTWKFPANFGWISEKIPPPFEGGPTGSREWSPWSLPFDSHDTTVDGRNPAPPEMYETLQVMVYFTTWTDAGFLPWTVLCHYMYLFCHQVSGSLALTISTPRRRLALARSTGPGVRRRRFVRQLRESMRGNTAVNSCELLKATGR